MVYLIDKILAALTIAGIVFWLAIIIFAPDPFYGAIYAIVLCGTLGAVLWFRWDWMQRLLREWPGRPFIKFVLIGYVTVLYEEVIAAFVNHLAEGFSIMLYLLRIGQFWALNIFAFTGFIIGWYFLLRRYQYTYREVFYLAGLWGLYAEGIFRHLASPLGMVMLIGPTIVIYGIIAMPMALSLPPGNGRQLASYKRYPLTFAVIFACSLLPVLVLSALRTQFPEAFPPTSMIP